MTEPSTNLPNGVTNVFEHQALGQYVAPDPSRTHQFWEDFDLYTAANWTVTETQAGATQAIVAGGDNGLLALTNSAADNDINAIAFVNETFVLDEARPCWFKARVAADDVALSDVLVGLVDTMAAFNPASGIYIYRDAVAGTIRLSVEQGGVVTNSVALVTSALDDTFYELAFFYDPVAGVVTAYFNDAAVLSIDDLTNFPTDALAPAVGVRNASAVARTLTVDYLFAAQART